MAVTQLTIDCRKVATRLRYATAMEGVATELRRMVYEDTVLLTSLLAAINAKGGAPAPITANLALAQTQLSNAMEVGGNVATHAQGPVCSVYVTAACDWLDAQAMDEPEQHNEKAPPVGAGL